MEKQNLILLRNILLKTFLIGLVFALFIFFMTTTFFDKWSSLVLSKVFVTKEDLGKMFVNSMLYTRFYLVFVILVPAIALHWQIKSKK